MVIRQKVVDLLQQVPEHYQYLKSNFCNRSSLLSAVNCCREELHLRCCRHPGSVFDDKICQKVIFIWWKESSSLIQQPSHLWKQPLTIVIRISCFSRGTQVSMVEDDPGLLSISQMDIFSLQVNDFHKLTAIVTERSMLHILRDPESSSAMIMRNKWFSCG